MTTTSFEHELLAEGSAVWTLAARRGGRRGFFAVGASAGDLARRQGTGTADGGQHAADGLAAGEAEAPAIAPAAAFAKRNHGERDHGRTERYGSFQVFSIHPTWRRHVPARARQMAPFSNTQGPLSSHDRCVICPCALGNAAIIRHIRQAEFGNSMSALANHAFAKMNGIGNEIVVVDLRDSKSAVTPEDARGRFPAGVPYDQLMVLQPPRLQGTEAFIRIYNNDGSEAGACGNGMCCVRCAACSRRPARPP